MKRGLLAIALGIIFLFLTTWIATLLTSIIPHRVTPQAQTAQAGPYQVTMQVTPNPPRITQPARLTIQVLVNASKQPVTNAHITLASNMEAMDMSTDNVEAKPQGNGMYLATVQFTMSGTWQVQVSISSPLGTQPATTVFEVTAQ